MVGQPCDWSDDGRRSRYEKACLGGPLTLFRAAPSEAEGRAGTCPGTGTSYENFGTAPRITLFPPQADLPVVFSMRVITY